MARGLRIFIQAAYFVLVARALGAEQYGLFIGVSALVKLVLFFAGWGSPQLIVKNVSRDKSLFNKYWGNALFITLLTSIALITFILMVTIWAIPIQAPILVVFLVALSELFFFKIFDIALKVFLAVGMIHVSAQLQVILSINSLLAALGLVVFFPSPNIFTWVGLYFISRVVTAAMACFWIYRTLGPPKLDLSLIKPELLQGFYFSIGMSSQTIYNDLDKTMLARLSTLGATGIYGAAYRLIDVAFTPVGSIMSASYAKFFQQGAKGIQGSLQFAKRLLPIAGTYGALASVGLYLIAPIVPYVLGDEYTEAVNALRWLSPLIFLKSMHYFAADTLASSGFQGFRSVMQVLIAFFNGIANLWLIPLYSWKGAAWSSIVSDSLLMFGLWGLVLFFNYQEKKISE